jgi:hypothetical protein
LVHLILPAQQPLSPSSLPLSLSLPWCPRFLETVIAGVGSPEVSFPPPLPFSSLSLSLPFSSLRAPSPSTLRARPCPGVARPCPRRRSPLPRPAARPCPSPVRRRSPLPSPRRRGATPPRPPARRRLAPAPPRGSAPRPRRGSPAPCSLPRGGLAPGAAARPLGAVPAPWCGPRPLRAASCPSVWLAWPRRGLALPRLPLTRSRVRNPTRAVIILVF